MSDLRHGTFSYDAGESAAGDVDGMSGGVVLEVVGEVVEHTPVEVFIHVAEAVALGGEKEEVEALVGTDECIGYAD